MFRCCAGEYCNAPDQSLHFHVCFVCKGHPHGLCIDPDAPDNREVCLLCMNMKQKPAPNKKRGNPTVREQYDIILDDGNREQTKYRCRHCEMQTFEWVKFNSARANDHLNKCDKVPADIRESCLGGTQAAKKTRKLERQASTAHAHDGSIASGHLRPTNKQRVSFPHRNQYGSAVFSQDVIHRDIAEHASKAIVFTRPMQMGKTTLFSLAEELFSKNKVAPNRPLHFMPEDKDKNKWFVLYLDFGSVTGGGSDDWQVLGKELDEGARGVISRGVHRLLRENTDLKKEFEQVDATSIKDQTTTI
jgi:hypothetical protein